jgi:broad specificity phosphatase PhoE
VTRLHLVRHGHAAAGWGDDPDPGLDALGASQADATAARLHAGLSPRPILSSPLLRAQATAAPLAARWGRTPEIQPAFGEIPSPTQDLILRQEWLSSALASRWEDLDDEIRVWRDHLLDAVRSAAHDTVVFTHFVAINAVVAAAEDVPSVTVFLPANASVTVIDVDRSTGGLAVVERGSEATPEVG